jgi:hypothetical protein
MGALGKTIPALGLIGRLFDTGGAGQQLDDLGVEVDETVESSRAPGVCGGSASRLILRHELRESSYRRRDARRRSG